MGKLTYSIPVIKADPSGETRSDASSLSKREALKTTFPYLTDFQLDEMEDLASEFKPIEFVPNDGVIDYENPKSINKDLFGDYFTVFNGGFPLRVIISRDGSVSVYRMPKNSKINFEEFDPLDFPEMHYTILMKKYRPLKVFLGENIEGSETETWMGSTILLELKPGKYALLYVGIEEFEIDDEILHYYALVGNSAVPYPLAVGKKYVYSMDSLKYFPIKIYNEDVPEENKFDFWRILYERSDEGKDLKVTKRIRNKGF